ncbi:hypothetical protein IF188_11555 [Microbacterium sp. NEAU-LLC]|uniref:VIT family protein n=1 Tax=Microbacterium helvum TaxID=2773713 RepID=A0ABR8NNU2_9MICO|nr:hypothetical protein [Microbacterium helvum]MBD3942334.1 hypothetical protein [Microbacterium helvum]
MTDEQLHIPKAVTRVLMSEEAVYGLILVSGMIVVSGTLVGTSGNALATVAITVVVFYLAHVYAGTLGRLAATEGGAELGTSIREAARHSVGMLLASIAPLVILLLGTTDLIDDMLSIWTALVVNAILLGVFGWIAVARWTSRFWPRLLSALITAGFGVILIGLKAFIHH